MLDSFPNAYITYKILLTIPITVVSATKKKNSKLKLIKSYLRFQYLLRLLIKSY